MDKNVEHRVRWLSGSDRKLTNEGLAYIVSLVLAAFVVVFVFAVATWTENSSNRILSKDGGSTAGKVAVDVLGFVYVMVKGMVLVFFGIVFVRRTRDLVRSLRSGRPKDTPGDKGVLSGQDKALC